MFCCECGSEMRLTEEPITETFRGEEITVNGIERYVCDECGNDFMSASEASTLSMALAGEYARRAGLLTPSEIRAIRTSLGLTQSDFERMVGVSTPTACRWERGTSLQPRSTDLLLRAIRDVPGVAGYLKSISGINDGAKAGGEILMFGVARNERRTTTPPTLEDELMEG